MKIQSIQNYSNTIPNFTSNRKAHRRTDTVKSHKKPAIIGAVAALAIAGIGAAVAIKKHNPAYEISKTLKNFNKINDNLGEFTQTLTKQADEILEMAQKSCDEVTSLFQKGEEIAPDGTVLRSITSDAADGISNIMEEFSQDGKQLRRTLFRNGTIQEITEGNEILKDGTKRSARGFIFNNGELSEYFEGYEETKNNIWSTLKSFSFEEGEFTKYAKGYKESSDGVLAELELDFSDGKLVEYKENCKKFWSEIWSAAKRIIYENNQPICYCEKYSEFPDDTNMSARVIDFIGGKPKKVSINEKNGIAQEVYELFNGK